MYDSGLSVGRSSNSEGFKALEALPKSDAPSSSAAASKVGSFFLYQKFFFFLNKQKFLIESKIDFAAGAGGKCTRSFVRGQASVCQ